MIVKLLGLKISLDLIILLLCLYLVMMVHVFASCCNAETLAEGFKIKSLRNQINKTLDKINGEEDNNKKLEEQKSKLLKQIEEQKRIEAQQKIDLKNSRIKELQDTKDEIIKNAKKQRDDFMRVIQREIEADFKSGKDPKLTKLKMDNFQQQLKKQDDDLVKMLNTIDNEISRVTAE
jgi:hypothetical protein